MNHLNSRHLIILPLLFHYRYLFIKQPLFLIYNYYIFNIRTHIYTNNIHIHTYTVCMYAFMRACMHPYIYICSHGVPIMTPHNSISPLQVASLLCQPPDALTLLLRNAPSSALPTMQLPCFGEAVRGVAGPMVGDYIGKP